jgi:hypothetical protein
MNEHKIFRPSPEMPAKLDSAYAKADRVAEEFALNVKSFIHEDESGSNRGMVENDLRYVEERKRNFEGLGSPEYKLAKGLEAALYERVNNDRWFGDRAKMIMPSEYDDLKNGIDGILEFQEGVGAKSHLGLAVDITYSQNPVKKFEIIKEQIDDGRLGLVKYFRSPDKTYEGRLLNLPRTILVLNAADATRVVRNWDEGMSDEGNEFRGLILRQLEIQLTAYQQYALSLERNDVDREPISIFFEGARRNVAALLSDVVSADELEKLDQHPILQLIRTQLESFTLEKA